MALVVQNNFMFMCRHWREYRKLSQLDLALEANVSQRHVSWLETGRSLPSREMVLRLSEALEIPLRERNSVLQSAGFSAAYTEKALDDPSMAPVLDALNHVLRHHDPMPAVVIDRFWNVKMKNKAAELLLGVVGDTELLLEGMETSKEINLALLTLHPQGLRPYIKNWDQVAPAFIRRLKGEAFSSGDVDVEKTFARYIELVEPIIASDIHTETLLPVLPLELNINGLDLSLFSVMSTFGTPQDVTTDELRIEAFYATDEKTEQFFKSVAVES
ncbi:MAG: transcriptional regulator with XRE-family HTH domain [Oceanicoccus sp.]|jgi:transcriptional regulator with XRE-family HTH domain